MSSQSYRVLIVAAHPDDIEFGCAGSVAVWADDGADVTYCLVTDGSTGTQDRELMGGRLAAIRRDEAERAAAAAGAGRIVFLGYPDGYVEYNLDLRRDLARMFRKVRPHRYVVLDPRSTIEDRFVNHPDHRAVGQSSLDVSMTAGTTPGHFPELLREGLEPWRGLRELWIMGPGRKPVAMDISATIDRKIAALLCHRSQLGDDSERAERWVREWTAEAGEPHGYAHAETFQVITQGPGFHPDEQEADIAMAEAPLDPRSARPPDTSI